MACAPNEDSDQPGHFPVQSESLLCTLSVAKDSSLLQGDGKDCSGWADAQADLSPLGTRVILLGLLWSGSFVLRKWLHHKSFCIRLAEKVLLKKQLP